MEDSREQAERLFDYALGLGQSDRDAYLDRVCRDAPSLRIKVQQMLDDDLRAGSFMNRPLFEPVLPLSVNLPKVSEDDVLKPAEASLEAKQPISRFKAGDVLAGRFIVVRFIAKGGMGEVFEVEDRQLQGVHIALKTVLSHFADDRIMQERFEREVLLAREVVHPNLCPIYDIFHWERPEGELTFLTMRLLPGETLAERLARTGTLSPAETARVAAQVAAGLSAAHNADILHRDIKAANIMLSGSADQVYACVTDFGLARGSLTKSTALTIGGIAGTPGYMAPELLGGDPPSKESDVFALGVVTYQMLTGHFPRTSLKGGRTGDPSMKAAIPAEWRRFIERCLDPDPAFRFKSASEALKAIPIAGHEHPDDSGIPQMSRRRMVVVGASACAFLGCGVWVERQKIRYWLEPLPKKRFVALMAWPPGDSSAVVLTILSSIEDRLARAEAQVKDLLIITFNDVRAAGPMPDSPTSSVAALGANLVLAASLRSDPLRSTLKLQVLDAATQKLLRKAEIASSTAELTKLAEKGSTAAISLLDLPITETPLSDQEELKRISSTTFRDFSEAEQLANEPNNLGLSPAILKYQQALNEDSHFALGYAKLAVAYARLYVSRGDAEMLNLATRNAAQSLRYNPLSARGLFSQALALLYSGKTESAFDYFAKSLRADPGNPDTLLYKAQAFRDIKRFEQAEQVYREIIKERPNYWPAYNELGYVLYRQAKYKEAAGAYDTAATAAPTVALPLASLGTMYLELGKRDEAIAASTLSLKRAPNDEAYLVFGDIAFTDGKYTSALDNYQRAAELNPSYHLTWRNIGDCYAVLHQPTLVEKYYARAAKVLSDVAALNPREVDWATLAFYHAKIHDAARAGSDLANAKAQQGNDVESRFMMVQALALLDRKEEALQLLLGCMRDGLSTGEVDMALDLEGLRKDPRYVSQVQRLKAANSSKDS